MDNSLVMALVWAWLASHPEHYCSYVRPFTQFRWSPAERRMLAVKVGGHYRHLAQWAKAMPAVACVCRFERLVEPRVLTTPAEATISRRGEFGLIPRRYRVLVFA